MKQLICILLIALGFSSYGQNFTTTASFIDFIEGEWEKVDTPTTPLFFDLSASKYLRFKFEKIVGDSLNVNVSATSNTGQPLSTLNFNCQTELVSIDQDSSYFFAFLNLHAVNQNLMYRFDSINVNEITLKMKMSFWTDYSQVFHLKRVNPSDTLITASSCDSVDIITSSIPFGCNGDSVYTSVDYSQTFVIERSTLDVSEVGTTIQRYTMPNTCDSIVVLIVNLLDSAALYLTNFSVGGWEWIYSTSGWGPTFADSLSNVYTIKIFENDSINFLPYSFYEDGTLIYCSSFYLLSESRFENAYYNYLILDGLRYNIYPIDSTTIAFEQQFVYDGPTHYWKRISNSTSSFISIPTCNINEVGIDTSIGGLCDSSLVITNTYLDCPSSINSFTPQSISIYPNPSANLVEFVTDEKINKIEVYDTGGRKLKVSYEIGTNSLDISHLNNGLYFVKISNELNAYTGKFVKN